MKNNKILLLLFFIPIFLYSSQQTTLDLLTKNHIYKKNEWKALLHYNKSLKINNNKYILCKKFSLKNEMQADIKAFYLKSSSFKNINNHPQCKFPARLLFIKHELNLSKNEFPQIICPEFKTYKDKAPVDDIGLIYVSENVKNPSSMMGHTFFKLSGKNNMGKKVTHAVTFYTVLDTYNLISLVYQNLYSGMPGKFVLQPYSEAINNYIYNENRNVWEYNLMLNDYKKKLLYYHLWELKDIDMKYYFTSYNCSTIVYYCLSLVNPKIYDDKNLWVTPLDTVKYLYKYNLVKTSKLIASNQWLIRMLEENIAKNNIENVKYIVSNHNYSTIKNLDFYSLELLKAYSKMQYTENNINKKQLHKIKNKINLNPSNNSEIFDISKYKLPSNIPPQRQVELGFTHVNKIDYTKISFLPTSHLLNDYNREYFGESELKLFYLSIFAKKDDIDLNEFTLFGMKSYLPYTLLTHDLSYQFELAIKKEYDKEMEYKNTAKIDGGVGFDFLIAKDINVFSIFNMGVGYNQSDKTHLFINPEFGLMIYEILNMKSLIKYQLLLINGNDIYDKYTLNHNIFLNDNWKLSADIESINGTNDYINYTISISKLF